MADDEPAPGDAQRWAGLRDALNRMRAERAAVDAAAGRPVSGIDPTPPGPPGGPTETPTAPSLVPGAPTGEGTLTSDRWSGLSAFRMGVFGGLGLAIIYMLYLSLDTIRSTLIVIAISALIAIGLDPAVSLLVRRGVKRALAVAIAYLALLAFVFGAFYAIIPPVATEVAAFITTLPKRLEALQHNATIKSLDDKFGLIEKVQKYVSGIAPDAASGVFTAAGIAVDLVVVLILTLYFLSGLPRITAAAYRLVPASRRTRVRDIGDKIIKQMGGYLGGATLIALQAGLVAGVFAWIAGLPYPWAIALAATLLDFVPVVGPIIIGVSMVLLGFSQSLIVGIIAGAFYLCQHLFEAYWLYPRVMRRTVHISSAAVIVAILVGAALLGVTGAILAVPVAAAVQLIVREVVLPRQERS
jgi:predicted PurR-regulated permease PerM